MKCFIRIKLLQNKAQIHLQPCHRYNILNNHCRQALIPRVMILGFYNHWSHRLYSILRISKKATSNMNKCYFRYMEQEEKVDISFIFQVKDSARQFNFSRNPSETVQTLFTRIEVNIKKAISKALKKKNAANEIEIGLKLYDTAGPIPDTYTCKELFNIKAPLNIKIYDTVYEAVFNAPWVLNMSLPQCLLVGFTVIPDHLQTLYAVQEECKYTWYKGLDVNDKGKTVSEIHIKWELVGNGFTYTPTPQDVGMKLKLECIPSDGKTLGPAVEKISKTAVEAGPGLCPFETRHLFTASHLKNERCVSYNILADLYCDSDYTRAVLHPYCPPYALHIDYRKQLITKELQGYNADIICLQEVDAKIFNNCLYSYLKSQGLEGLFCKKGKEVAEGLATFYRSSRFKNIGEDKIVLSEALKSLDCLKLIWDAVQQNESLAKRVLDRSTVASATFLESIDNPKELLIAGNTHLYFHPDADHIRLIQGGIVIYWLSDLKKKLQIKFPEKRISLIMCGDFNSVPSCGIFQLFTTGHAPNSLPDWNSNLSEAVENLSLNQDILLESGCGTPEYTNFTNGFADCLDYIYYEKSNLAVEQVVPFPSMEELKIHTALPSIVFPSDHIALISDLRFV